MSTINKIILGLIVVVVAVGAYFYFGSNKTAQTTDNSTSTQQENTPPQNDTPTPSPSPTTMSDNPVVVIETNFGNIELTLDSKQAPKTVANFVKLSKDGFYNGTKFHRVIDWFVIQGGDPNSKDNDPTNDGYGGPGYNIDPELGGLGSVGAIGMASGGPGTPSSGSQFFIVTQESEKNHGLLDKQYTFFGKVTAGMDVVTKIATTPTDPTNDRPKSDVIINKVTVK